MNLYKHPKLREAFELFVREQNARLPGDEELAWVTFSHEFETMMETMIRRQKRGYYLLFGTVARRVATVVIALILSATVVTFSVEALREPVVRFFTEVFETFTRVVFVDDTSEPEQVEMEKKAPTYIPEGYEVESETEIGIVYRITYTNGKEEEKIYYRQEINNGNVIEIDTEEIKYFAVTVGQMEAIAYENKGMKTIMFTDGQYSYYTSGALSQDELIKIAESIIL